MKKVLIIYAISKDDPNTRGIYEKMKGLEQGFTSNGHDVDLVYLSDAGLLFKQEVIRERSSKSLSRYFFFLDAAKIFKKQLKYDVVYIRYAPISPFFTKLIIKAKEYNPAVKVVLEMPTYPFHNELSLIKNWVNRVLSHSYKRWPSLVSLIVTPGNQQEIYGVKAMKISNGIDTSQIGKKVSVPNTNQSINMVCVTRLWAWQGLEQFLNKWADVYNSNTDSLPNMTLTIVGEGSEEANLKKKVRTLYLEDRVFFLGSKFGKDLDLIIEGSDIGIGVISDPTRGLEKVSALKHRFYAAKGLPFVYGIIDDDFINVNGFLLLNQELDLCAMIKWYQEEIYPEYQKVSMELRNYAEEKLSWSSRVERIIKELF